MAMLIQLADGSSGIKIPILHQRTAIGRDNTNEIILDDELVSKEHAVIEVVTGKKGDQVDYIIQDLKSTNHTFVNDSPIDLHKLRDGDVIRIGKSNFQFMAQDVATPDETAKLYRTWIPGVYYTGKKKK